MTEKTKKYIGSIFLTPVAVFLILNRGDFIFILDHINLLFHEGGHGIFKIFGGFIYTLGGSLMQLIIPSLFIFYFASNKKKIGLQISILYLAQNLMNISVYVADARLKILPLLGGKNVYHDWNYIFSRMNILEYDVVISQIIYYTAVCICVLALLLPMLGKEYKTESIDLNL
ncbi:MAG: hypothetical protein CVV23_05730 [Ignavibacteriae bacterium HGW-Ignavibacteriae-2]|jgi:hypothetical protein|nr:MAG: hypothetical protein CVV23_05730 [Ignavibacteriae bacterium HGW-Ignavibacteriae-2]